MIKDSIGVVGTATPRPSLRLKVDVTPSGPRPRPRSSYEVETCCTRRRFSLQNIGCTVKRLRWLRHAHQCGATPPRSASCPQHAPRSGAWPLRSSMNPCAHGFRHVYLWDFSRRWLMSDVYRGFMTPLGSRPRPQLW